MPHNIRNEITKVCLPTSYLLGPVHLRLSDSRTEDRIHPVFVFFQYGQARLLLFALFGSDFLEMAFEPDPLSIL